jgi:hypothetical protein
MLFWYSTFADLQKRTYDLRDVDREPLIVLLRFLYTGTPSMVSVSYCSDGNRCCAVRGDARSIVADTASSPVLWHS